MGISIGESLRSFLGIQMHEEFEGGDSEQTKYTPPINKDQTKQTSNRKSRELRKKLKEGVNKLIQ